MTEEDVRKVYTQLYNIDPTRDIFFGGTMYFISDMDHALLYYGINDTINTHVDVEHGNLVSRTINLIDCVSNYPQCFNILNLSYYYFDKNVSIDNDMLQNFLNFKDASVTVSSPTAPIPDGATNTEYTVTLYYMER